jgi:prevent-host-death family protein
MTKLNIHEAKTHLSRYLHRVQEGETILLCKNGIPIAQITPLTKEFRPKKRLMGLAKGLGKVTDKFFEPLTDDDLPGMGL